MALTAADSSSRVKPKPKPKESDNDTDNASDCVTDPGPTQPGMLSGPRLAFTISSRPISVDEDAKRMSSLRAERVVEEAEEEDDVRGGATREDSIGMERSRVFTDASGKVFI
jgi:hypothetical protein